jgi:hypothetical protein
MRRATAGPAAYLRSVAPVAPEMAVLSRFDASKRDKIVRLDTIFTSERTFAEQQTLGMGVERGGGHGDGG